MKSELIYREALHYIPDHDELLKVKIKFLIFLEHLMLSKKIYFIMKSIIIVDLRNLEILNVYVVRNALI